MSALVLPIALVALVVLFVLKASRDTARIEARMREGSFFRARRAELRITWSGPGWTRRWMEADVCIGAREAFVSVPMVSASRRCVSSCVLATTPETLRARRSR